MEYRKLIAFGKSSHVVSVPKTWLTQNNLQKGDSIALSIRNENLILRPKTSQKENEAKQNEILINIDGKSDKYVEKEIISAYINNCSSIILEGNEIKKRSKQVQELIHDLIALEVMEQDAEKIVAKDFLNMKDINVKNLIQKMDVISRAMLTDTKNMFKEDNYENIEQRDKDVNRLFFLAYRSIKYGLRNPLTVSQLFNISSNEELMDYRMISAYIEAICDSAKRIARYMKRAKITEKQKKEFVQILDKINHQFISVMEAYYSQDKVKALKLCDNKEDIIQDCLNWYKKSRKADWIGILIDQVKTMFMMIYSIARIVHQ